MVGQHHGSGVLLAAHAIPASRLPRFLRAPKIKRFSPTRASNQIINFVPQLIEYILGYERRTNAAVRQSTTNFIKTHQTMKTKISLFTAIVFGLLGLGTSAHAGWYSGGCYNPCGYGGYGYYRSSCYPVYSYCRPYYRTYGYCGPLLRISWIPALSSGLPSRLLSRRILRPQISPLKPRDAL
jgi:hypothetical protein